MTKANTVSVFALACLAALPVWSVEPGFDQVAVFATNSAWLQQGSDVLSGDVVVNQDSSSPPHLTSFQLTIGLATTTPVGFAIKADEIKVKSSAVVGGTVFCNILNDGSGSVTCSPLSPLPVFSLLPNFNQGSTGGPQFGDVTVAIGGSAELAPGDYGDLLVKKNGSVSFTGGVYSFRSINGGIANTFTFEAPSEVRVEEKFDTDKNSTVGPSAGCLRADVTPCSAADIIFYVAGINGSTGNLGATPKAASVGLANTVNANFYVPNGTLHLRQNTNATGAFLGRDTNVGKGVQVSLDSFFFNRPPVAVDDSATVAEDSGTTTIDVLANDVGDPVLPGQALTIDVIAGSGNSHVKIVGNQVEYTPNPNFFGTDTFGYTVCDGGADCDTETDSDDLCATATVTVTVTPVNDPPAANAQDVFTNGDVNLPITLTGSDVDGDTLTFTIVSGPDTGKGSLSAVTPDPPASATVTYDPVNANNEENEFTFQVDDNNGGTAAAIVRINPGGDPECFDDNDCDAGFFCNAEKVCEPVALGEVEANDQLCISTNPVDCALETVEGTAITIVLTATAPCDPTGAPNPAEPCDGLPTAVDDVPLTFSLPSPTTSQGGTLSGLNQGTGELQEPPGADEVPQRSAHVLYTPPATFTGVDSFTFQVVGDVDGSGGIDPSAEPNPEVDIATVEISVQTFTPVPPVEARDQRVSTPKDTPVDISLSGPGEPCDPNTDPSCRQQPQGPASAPSGTVSQSSPAAPRSSRPVSYVADATGAGQYFGPTARARASISPGGGAPAPLAAATGEELYAIDSDLDQLFELSPVDASSTLVGSTAAGPTTPASLAFDGTDMFTIDLGGGGLYTLDLNTGVPTLVCSTGVSGWQGVASDPTDEGQFYGITQSDDLHKIDRTTCTTTRVNATAGTVGGLIAALEFDANGTLWGAEFGSPGSTTENAALVTIDKATGAVTVVSQCATRPCSGNDNFADGFQGIDFSTDGTLYGQNTNDDSLYIIDTTDGSLTFLGSNATIFVKGLAFSEEVLLEATFTILTLPAVGTLSYLEPLSGVQTDITAGDLPLALVTEQVTYTPPVGATGDPLASFTFQQSDGITSDTGLIELVVTGEIIIVDSCAEVGRPTGCSPGGQGPVSAPAPTVGGLPSGSAFTVSVSGPGDVSSNRPHVDGVSYRGLLCSADSDCRANFVPGSIVVLYARPVEAGSEFVEWGGDCSGSDPVALVTANPDAFCTATFRGKSE
ncbi:MAG: Ig-like domain-containing protein [Thermoanaerobaculia bacterium]